MNSALLLTRILAETVLLQAIPDELTAPLTGVALLLLGIGLVNIYLYRSKKATADLLENTPVTKIDSLTDGTVAVSGTARPAESVLERPTTDGECIAYERRTQTTRKKVDNNPDGDNDRDVSFQTTNSSSSESTAFYVEDDTGTVQIADGETPKLHLNHTDSVTEVPDDLDEKEREYRSREAYTLVTEKNHRYHELLPGDEVFVFGGAHRGEIHDGGEEGGESHTDIRITEDSESGDFIVSTFDKEWLLDENTNSVQLVIGLVVTGLSLGLLAYIWLL